jgi:hypothetical protein
MAVLVHQRLDRAAHLIRDARTRLGSWSARIKRS